MLEELHVSWESLVRRLDRMSASVDPLRIELLVLLESGLSLKFHAVGMVYRFGYYSILFV